VDLAIVKEAWDIHDDYLELVVTWAPRTCSEEETHKWTELVNVLKEYRCALNDRDFEQLDIRRCELEGITAQIRYIHRVVHALK